jgi:hypothetical protein
MTTVKNDVFNIQDMKAYKEKGVQLLSFNQTELHVRFEVNEETLGLVSAELCFFSLAILI